MSFIPLYKPYITGNELTNIEEAIASRKLAGNGPFTEACQQALGHKVGHPRVLLTTSCTTALEMAALLIGVGPGDEVIVPAYTFPATANAFLLTGARVKFADSLPNNPNVDPESVKALINANTKAVVIMHYAGVACDMDKIVAVCEQYKIALIEDAAQALDATYKGKPLGTFGKLSAFSFHETKNVNCGEGGCLVINDEQLMERAEIIWDGGTNRVAFKRGKVNHYAWQDLGSSFMMPEISAAFLKAQLDASISILNKRSAIWETYYKALNIAAVKANFDLPVVPDGAQHNAHIFYLICKSNFDRDMVIAQLKALGVGSAFHYLTLHNSPRQQRGQAVPLPLIEAERLEKNLIRLPLYVDMSNNEVQQVIQAVLNIVR